MLLKKRNYRALIDPNEDEDKNILKGFSRIIKAAGFINFIIIYSMSSLLLRRGNLIASSDLYLAREIAYILIIALLNILLNLVII